MSQLPFIESLNIDTSIKFEQNKILIDAGGREQRIVPHQSPIREYNLSKNALTQQEAENLYALFKNVEGNKKPFLYTDKSDHTATHFPKTLYRNGAYSQGIVLNSYFFYGNARRPKYFLLCKAYGWLNNLHYRPIHTARNLRLYKNLGNETYEEIDSSKWTTQGGFAGEIFELEQGALDGNISADFEFDVPVRFKEKTLDVTNQTQQPIVDTNNIYPLHSLQVTLIEDKYPLPFYIKDNFNDLCWKSDVTTYLDLDFRFKGNYSQTYNTQIKPLPSGYTTSVQYQAEPVVEKRFGERSRLLEEEMEYMIAHWLCVKGSGAFWIAKTDDFYNYAAYRDNTLSYTLMSPMPKQYSIAPLSYRIWNGTPQAPAGFRGLYGSVLTVCDCVIVR